MVLFLGAGATQPFGPKTLQSSALMEKVFSVVENEFGSHIIANMKEKLRKHRLPLNFESIATIMEFFKNPEEVMKESGPLTAYLTEDLSSNDYREEAGRVSAKLKTIMYKNCVKLKREKIQQYYDRLFKVMVSVEGGLYPREIFTTNYDLSIEQYFEIKRKSRILNDGFVERQSSRWRIFEPHMSYGPPDKSKGTRLFKLHGSIDQVIRNQIILKGPRDSKIYKIEFDKDMMIYPIGEKYISRYPYLDLIYYFYRIPWDLCIVIGFSFTDLPITNIFYDHVKRNSNSRVILVDKDPHKIMQYNLMMKELYEKDRIVLIKGYFGKEDTFGKIEKNIKKIVK